MRTYIIFLYGDPVGKTEAKGPHHAKVLWCRGRDRKPDDSDLFAKVWSDCTSDQQAMAGAAARHDADGSGHEPGSGDAPRQQKTRAPALTRRRLRACAMALNAMLAGEDGEGDWDPSFSRRDLEDALKAVDARLDAMDARIEEKANRLSTEMEQDYLEQHGE